MYTSSPCILIRHWRSENSVAARQYNLVISLFPELFINPFSLRNDQKCISHHNMNTFQAERLGEARKI